jgi:16S rRNA (guanine527-N7)-methyltransferase
LHSLALAKTCSFPSGSQVIDIGTGGGFPGIPLAIVFPDVNFTMCDSIGKKIMVVNDVIEQLELHNSQAINSRTETINLKFDIATARAVAPAINLWNWMNGQWRNKPRFHLLKGGDLTEELNELRLSQPRVSIEETAISTLFEEAFFETKKVISIG